MIAVRNLRSTDILSPELVAAATVTIIGCGAIGGAVARLLATMGTSLILIDHDKVAPENLGPQSWSASHLGKLKVEALAQECLHLNDEITVTTHAMKYARDVTTSPYVFCCVDSMAARAFIFESVLATRPAFFCDTRMAAEVARILVVRGLEDARHYHSTLHSDQEAVQLPCTAKATVFGATYAASLAVHQLRLCFTNSVPYAYEQLGVLPFPLCSEHKMRFTPCQPLSSTASPAPTSVSGIDTTPAPVPGHGPSRPESASPSPPTRSRRNTPQRAVSSTS